MIERSLSDADLAAAVGAWAPETAPAGSADRLGRVLGSTRQQRPLPFPFGPLFDVDPIARRSARLVAALLLVGMALASAAAAGALRPWLSTAPSFPLDPPTDLQAYMVAVAQDSPTVRPMAFTVVHDRGGEGPAMERVYQDGTGRVRVERYASAGATEPDGYLVVTRDELVELAHQGPESVWVEWSRDWDTRDWVFTSTAAYIGVADRGCEMLEVDRSAGWQYVGLEQLLGRPVHHLRCDGDFWVDVETRLVLKSRSSGDEPRTDAVTSLELGPQPAALFDTTKPEGLRTVTWDEQRDYETNQQAAEDCAANPICAAPDVPLITPPPADGAPAPDDPATVVAKAIAARNAAPPLHLTMNHWRSQGGDARQGRLEYMGMDRFRVEWGADRVSGEPASTRIVVGAEEGYESTSGDEGDGLWRHVKGRSPFFDVVWWLDDMLIALPEECGATWRLLSVDRVGSFTADHLECDGTEYWVDRGTSLVVRRQTPPVDVPGYEVWEVTDLSFAPTPEERFRLPDGAVLETPPPPDPNSTPTPAPQKSTGG